MSVLLPNHREREFGSGQDYVRRGHVWVPPYSGAAAPPAPLGLDLFAGCGGFSLGFHMAGWHVIAASEWWPIAVQTYLANLGSPATRVYVGETAAPDATKRERRLFEARGGSFIPAGELFELLPLPKEQRFAGFPDGPGSGWIARPPRDHDRGSCEDPSDYVDPDGAGITCDQRHGDIGHRLPCEVMFCCDVRELTGDFISETLGLERGDLGCVFGGPPCQGFSVANVNTRDKTTARHDPRNQLVFEFGRLVVELQPKTMVMENVPAIVNMVTPEGIPVIDALSLMLSDGGMGDYEALRRSLRANAGAGVAIKGASRPKRERLEQDAEEVDEAADFLQLFTDDFQPHEAVA